MPRLFGTDGVRGVANKELTPQLALKLGEAAARILGSSSQNHTRRRAIIGRDTRISGDFLSAALAAGMASGGVDVIDVGVLPTPGIAYLSSILNVDFAAVVSASHNPMQYNGIKFFQKGGYKLSDNTEDEIEALLDQEWERPINAFVGRISYDAASAQRLYIQHILDSVIQEAHEPLHGLHIVVDCANGATSHVAPEVLQRAGATVTVINAAPDGRNINDHAGTMHPETLQTITKAMKADLGVACDGDADRCLAVDHNGTIVNGDQIMGILARSFKNKGLLKNDTLVVTVMSNLGLKLALRDMGITTVQTAVGDRYVLEEMLKNDYSLGGEQSGHIINRYFATTGDGTLTALMLAREVAQSGKTLEELASAFPQLPQELINVRTKRKREAFTNTIIQEAIHAAEEQLGETGRVLLRPSGTEPLVRVMVEAVTDEQAHEVCQSLASIVEDALK